MIIGLTDEFDCVAAKNSTICSTVYFVITPGSGRPDGTSESPQGPVGLIYKAM